MASKKHFDVLTVGTASRDVFLKSPLFKVVKDPEHLEKLGFEQGKAECFAFGGKIDINEIYFDTGGGATNAAVTFARQGFRTGTITSLGEDKVAEEVLAALRQEGIQVFHSLSKKPSSYSTLLLTEEGERTVLVARGASDDLDLKSIPLASLTAKWLYISPGAIKFSMIEKLVNYFQKQGANIAINPSAHCIKTAKTKLKKLLKKVQLVILNRSEAAQMTGAAFEQEREILKKLSGYTEGIIVMTEGPQGVLVSNGRYIYRAGTFKESAVRDRTGAGDAFGSGFAAALMKDPQLNEQVIREAIRLGSANATAVVERIGAKTGILDLKTYERAKHFKNLTIRKTLL
ncbi:MAG: carbohydrate kinase family protein [Candidatus Harrisonbacteria bacterium]|nr:carbohydrate kinase family protein [Candidatus Harrisonbacteria bacterium]